MMAFFGQFFNVENLPLLNFFLVDSTDIDCPSEGDFTHSITLEVINKLMDQFIEGFQA